MDDLEAERRRRWWQTGRPIRSIGRAGAFIDDVGFALLFRGFMQSTFRLTARFDEAGPKTRITVVGTAHPRDRRRLAELAAANGGPVGMTVGV